MLKTVSDQGVDILHKLSNIESIQLPAITQQIIDTEASLKTTFEERLAYEYQALLEAVKIELTLQLFGTEQRMKGLWLDEVTFTGLSEEEQAAYFSEMNTASLSEIVDKSMSLLAHVSQMNENMKLIAEGLGYSTVDYSDILYSSIFKFNKPINASPDM